MISERLATGYEHRAAHQRSRSRIAISNSPIRVKTGSFVMNPVACARTAVAACSASGVRRRYMARIRAARSAVSRSGAIHRKLGYVESKP
jgi:hypothetical protein